MDNKWKKLIACVTVCVLLATMVYIPTEVKAANEFYGDYTDVSMIYDYGTCPSMQGIAVGSTYMYTVKIGSDDTRAFIAMTHKDTGNTTKLYNADADSYYFSYLGHANDMDVWGIDGYSNLFVATLTTGSNAIVRLKRDGTELTKAASYSLSYNGNQIAASALVVKSVSGGVINFITKLNMTLYTGSVSTSATSADIELTKLCDISKSRVYIKGSYLDLSDYVNQGFGYYKDLLYVPITGDSSELNRSVIMVFDLSNAQADETIFPTEALVFRVTSGAYSALFEIESCGICPSDGKLYFSTNRRKTDSDTNYDGVSYVDDYTFESIPIDSPTSAPTYTIHYNANGGSGSMEDTVVTYGTYTNLRTNTFVRPGYAFKGWTAYRTIQDQWYYSSGWYTEGSQPSEDVLTVYKDGTRVARTSSQNGDVVQFYAQWELIDYTVSFQDEDGTVLQTGTYHYGDTVTPPADPVKASDDTYSYTFAGWSPTVSTVSEDVTYVATYTAAPLGPQTTATGTVEDYLDRVNTAAELVEGVPYVISDYKDSWLHYTLTSEYAEKVAGSKTHKGFLLSGEASPDTPDLWYIKDGHLVYGSADSDQYLNIYYDSSSQGVVELSSYDPTNSAYVSRYSGDDHAIRSSSYFLNRHGGTASDYVATAYHCAGGSYWHLDRLVTGQAVTFTAVPSLSTVPLSGKSVLAPVVELGGTEAEDYTIAWSVDDPSVASISTDGTVTPVKTGTVCVTATLSEADGHPLTAPISIEIPLEVVSTTAATASTVLESATVTVGSIQTGVPYVITEAVSGHALTGDMLYTSDGEYCGLNGVQGLKVEAVTDLDDAPVWYYDGTYLRYGSPNGSYLVYNSNGQVALGDLDDGYPFDGLKVYSSSGKTFDLYPSGKTSGSTYYYLNQLGGSKYNVAGLYSSAYYSRWQFDQWFPERTVSLGIDGDLTAMLPGNTVDVVSTVTVDGTATDAYSLTWTSSDTSVATVDANGTVTAKANGDAVITAALTAVDGVSLDAPLYVELSVSVSSALTAQITQEAELVLVDTLQTGVPYVITERVSGAALTGTMLYSSDSDYCGLNGLQGLMTVDSFKLANAPVWYYDGTHLCFGTSTGSDNYLVYNSDGQVALGQVSDSGIFDCVKKYSSSNKTFNIYPSSRISGSTKYYLNQMGGANYNVAGLYSSAYYSQWRFHQLLAQRDVSLSASLEAASLSVGGTAQIAAAVGVDGAAVSSYILDYTTSDADVATVSADGQITATGSGSAVITVTLTQAQGRDLTEALTVQITVQVD